MGKAALIAVVAFATMSTLYMNSSKRGMLRASEGVANHQYATLARSAAVNGVNLAKQALAESFTSQSFKGEFDRTEYAVAIQVAGNRAKVVSAATITNATGEESTYRIAAEFLSLSGELSPTPNFARYALVTDETLNLGGSIVTEVFVQGEEGAELNANMHSNASLHINGDKVHVEGYGTYMDNASANPARALQGSFQPNYVAREGDTCYRASTEVAIPAFDSAAYVQQLQENGVTVHEISGDYMLDGTLDLGDRENPTVYLVTGNLTATGNSVVNGYGMFIVDGAIDVSGNLEVGTSGYGGPDESSLALYSGGGVEINGTIDVAAQIYTGGSVALSGNPNIYGSIAAKGSASLQGSPKIYYRSSSPALTQNWQKREKTIKLAAYNER